MGRNKVERTNLHARVAIDTTQELKQIAFEFDLIHGNEGSIGQLLDAIAKKEIILSRATGVKSSNDEIAQIKQQIDKLEKFKSVFEQFVDSFESAEKVQKK